MLVNILCASKFRVAHAVMACVCGTLMFSICSCYHDGIEDVALPHESEREEYWYTRTRSAQQQSTMLRSHAVGFSYDAVYGEYCSQNSVRCQVLDLERLSEESVYSLEKNVTTYDENYVAHSLSECLSNMESSFAAKGDFYICQKEGQKYASMFQKRTDKVVLFTNTRICQILKKKVIMDRLRNIFEESDDPYVYLSPGFRYAIDKIRRNKNVAVVDSFIEIFGTHVVTQANVGGSIKLDLVSTTSDIKSAVNEKTMSFESIDLYLYESTSSSSSEKQTFFNGVVKNAELYLSVNGGDVSVFNKLVLNPHDNNRSAEMLTNWARSLDQGSSSDWNSRLELADMQVTPIWEFIPDATVAARVRARIEASAPTMQDLYGNRNFIDVKFPSSVNKVSCKLGGTSKTFTNPYVVDVFAANRHVATICREWVPEIDTKNSVVVAYPIYENQVQLDAGVCIRNENGRNVAYNVKWTYDGFSVTQLADSVGETLYLQAGFIKAEPHSLVRQYQTGKLAIGYEWPGSIGVDGTLQKGKSYYTTRKFLDKFYLDTTKTFTDLPNWSKSTTKLKNSRYENDLNKVDSYKASGLPENEKTNRLLGRMVRNADYTYYYNPLELSW